MKLIKRTYFLTALWLLPVMIIGSIFCFEIIEYIAYEETDEFLTYEMDRLINYHQENKALPEFHKVADILPGVAYDAPLFRDTMLLEPGDNEMVPNRELRFTIIHNEEPFTIVLRHLLLGRDDVMEGTFLIILGLMLLVALFVVLILNQVTTKIWQPFYQTLGSLKAFKIGSDIPQFPSTEIDEFKTLNTTLEQLLKKMTDDFHHNKEFNENASHELQTHLAIIRANTEKLLNKASDEETSMIELQKIYTASNRLTQVQKSLLLLSKINNEEYSNPTDVDLEKLLDHYLGFYEEALQLRGITVKKNLQRCVVHMDQGLAEILINNLLKNAVKHNVQDGYLSIQLSTHALEIENSGLPFTGKTNKLFERFSKGENGNIGIGLAIVKQICELYQYAIRYELPQANSHKIILQFNPKRK